MSAFLIATFRFNAEAEYRSVYYRETLDGRARFGPKIEAHRFTAPGADVVAGQLRSLHPRDTFHVIEENERPPRPTAAERVREITRQVEAFAEERAK